MLPSFKFVGAGDATPILVKKGTTSLTSLILTNKNAAARYLKCYDAAKVSDVTVGTTPVDLTVILGATTTRDAVFAAMFQKGLVVVVTTGIAETDTAAPSARDVVGYLGVD